VANTWIEIGPCNYHLRTLAADVKEGIRAAGATPMEFNTVSISDGITMGTEGMRASLVSREVIADSIELVARGNGFDALVVLVGCDKTIPGGVMALARLNIPGLILYGGSIAAGQFQNRSVTIQDVFEAVGAHAAGRMSDRDFTALEDAACPGAGACGGQFTANTMAIVCECLGIAALGSGSVPATDPAKAGVARRAGEMAVTLAARGIRPRSIITRKSIENAIAVVAATGGSTNAVLHLMAIAKEAGVELALPDFDRISSKTPLLVDLKPSGRFVATELHAAGGSTLVVKRLIEAAPSPATRRRSPAGPWPKRRRPRLKHPAGSRPPDRSPAEADGRPGDSLRQPRSRRRRPEALRGTERATIAGRARLRQRGRPRSSGSGAAHQTG
jgi:dihydroxy-acid dehydratase